jgi:hypothetical protein
MGNPVLCAREPSGLSQSNYYYKGGVFSMCPLLLSRSGYLNNNVPI